MAEVKIKSTGASLVVKDIEKAQQWYQQNLGFISVKKMDFPEFDNLQIHVLKNNDFELELMSKNSSFSIQKHVPDYSVNKHPLLGFYKWVLKVENFDEMYDLHLKRKVTMPYPKTYDKTFERHFYIISDPDDNSIQIIESR
ncbi:MAG: VOC family protein [Marinicella sp.]